MKKDVISEVGVEMTDTGERGLARAVADMGENETGQDKAEDMTWYDAATGLDEPVDVGSTVAAQEIMRKDIEDETSRQPSSDDTIIYQVQPNILKKDNE